MSNRRNETQTNLRIQRRTPGSPRGVDRRVKRSNIVEDNTLVARSIVVSRSGVETRLRIHEDEKYTFGRAASNDVVFDDDRVSRQQGVLRFHNACWWFFDVGSANGSLVGPAAEIRRVAGGQEGDAVGFRPIAVGEPAALRPGDGVLLGTRTAWFELDTTPVTASAPLVERGPGHRSAATRDFEQKLDIAARTELPVFLRGPSGSGKTHAARQIHDRSGSKGHFVIINCARLPTDIGQLHSELLGHVKGGFTGAVGDRVGKLLHANGGTLFLDEVESLPDVAQGFLLDLLEGTGDVSAFGASPSKKALPPPQFRLISASKTPLSKSGLRRDLCERLAQGYTWKVPTLEDRREDIPALIESFLREQSETRSIEARFSDEAVKYAKVQDWPGQIRELRSMVVALVQAANARNDASGKPGESIVVQVQDVRDRLRERDEAFMGTDYFTTSAEPITQRRSEPNEARPVHPRSLTREDVARALKDAGGNKTAAARALGIARNTLASRMREFKLI